mmetsp:Transcript_136268/g.322852  ORF Transcript_136268/g.322852 Transcript_136268/m.322852 type:complete len:149 (-) Transcript_136268:195-641(-)
MPILPNTTLILRSSKTQRYPELIDLLNRVCLVAVPEVPYPYDFVHLPWKKLAVVNFISSSVCARCHYVLRLIAEEEGINDLKFAQHQGLVQNLAFCVLRSSSSLERKPLVFHEGEQVPLALACEKLVPMSLIGRLKGEAETPRLVFDL